MLAGAVYAIAETQAVYFAKHIVRSSCLNAVKVKSNEVTPTDSIGFTPAAFKSTAHKSADVLQIVLLRLRQRKVFRKGFGAPAWRAELFAHL